MPRCDPRFHRGSDPQRLVNPAEIIIREVQAVRSPQILPLLAESARQPRQASNAPLFLGQRTFQALPARQPDEPAPMF